MTFWKFEQDVLKSWGRRHYKKLWLRLVYLTVLVHFGHFPLHKIRLRPGNAAATWHADNAAFVITGGHPNDLRLLYSPTNTESTTYLPCSQMIDD